MATAAARLLQRSFSLFAPYNSVASSYSFRASHQLPRFSPSGCARVKLLLPQLLHNSPLRSLTFCSAASADDSDGDTVAAPELYSSGEVQAAPPYSATSSVEPDAGTEATPYSSLPADEPLKAVQSESGRFPQIPMKKGDWICSQCKFMNFARNFRCLECKTLRLRADGGRLDQVEVKSRDWTCSRCGFMNFSKNIRCLQCKADMPSSGFGNSNIVLKKGDWHCPACSFMNFAKNTSCLQCNVARPLKEGDWNCPKCQFLNFCRNSSCRRCQEVRPEKDSTHWECPSCKFLNFESRSICLECNFKRPTKKSGLDLSMEGDGSTNTKHQTRESLLFDDNLFVNSNNGASSLDDMRN